MVCSAASGRVFAWGANGEGQCGFGFKSPQVLRPARFLHLPVFFLHISCIFLFFFLAYVLLFACNLAVLLSPALVHDAICSAARLS